MKDWNNDDKNRTVIGRLRKDLDEQLIQMNENHELVLKRGEKIQNVLDKSENLKDHTHLMKRKA